MTIMDVSEHFDRRAEKYNSLTPWTKDDALVDKAIAVLGLWPGSKVIDIGAGTGSVVERILVRCSYISTCVALDNSPQMLDTIQNDRISTCLADAHAIPYEDGAFSHALARQSLHYMKDVAQVLREVYRILQRGGVFCVTQITPFGVFDQEHWARLTACRQPLRRHCLTVDQIVRLLFDAGFVLSMIDQIRFRTSLSSWISRYEIGEQQRKELWIQFREAPAAYRAIHAIEDVGNDIKYDNCWTYIQAVKP